MTHTPSRAMVRGRSGTRYSAELEVEYADRKGEPASAPVLFGTPHPDAIPAVGDRLPICRGLSGMVTHPDRTLIGIGGAAAVIGGLLLFLHLLTRLRVRRR
ncbi:MAG: hypothetical protein IJH78_02890 [Clostridia bacterium]|nr:hypothetical protein [Clostridia bacterium]